MEWQWVSGRDLMAMKGRDEVIAASAMLDLQWVVDGEVELSKSALSRSGTRGRRGAVEKIRGAIGGRRGGVE